jgi:hypothetical protein
MTTRTAAGTGDRGQRGGSVAAQRHRKFGVIERRLFQRLQALEDAITYRRARIAAPCPDCWPSPDSRCDDHCRDVELIREYLRTSYQTSSAFRRAA